MDKSKKIYNRAINLMPGGVNSPVRAFKSVGQDPVFIKSGKGAYITDIDEKEYIDYVCSWGPMILGHNNEKILNSVIETARNGLSFGAPTELEVTLADLIISSVPNIDLIRMVNSGTEAVMSAIRLARGYTKKDKIIKFEGCYHGHSDSMLVKAGSGLLTNSVPTSLGIIDSMARDTLIANYNDLQSVKELLESNEVACIIVEPVGANMGVVPPNEDFLTGLRDLCDEYHTLLIFDEVITGFRLGLEGAQGYYNVSADLVTYGKIIGGGMPVGAYGGRREIMDYVAPVGNVYQAGTLSGNPIAMAAGIAQFNQLNDKVYNHIEKMGELLETGLNGIISDSNVKAITTRVGSLVCLFFGIDKAESFENVKNVDTDMYARYFTGMLEGGIYLAPSQFEAMFISYSHGEKEINHTLNVAREIFKTL